MKELLEQINELALKLVGIDSSDLVELAHIHTGFETLLELASQSSDIDESLQQTITAVAVAAGNLVEQVVLSEVDNPTHAIEAVGESCSTLQQLLEQIEQGDGAQGISFPDELGLIPDQVPACPEHGKAAPKAKATDQSSNSAQNNPATSDSAPTSPVSIALPENVDESIFREFLSNQPDVLASLEQAILEAEQDPSTDNRNTIAGILHNLKGESGLLGLQEVSGYCHKTESMLLESQDHFPAEELFAAKDWLMQAITSLTAGPDNQSAQNAQGDSDAIAPTADSDAASTEPPDAESQPAEPEAESTPAHEQAGVTISNEDIPLVNDFISESNEHLENAEGGMLSLEESSDDPEVINAIFRAFHTIKGVAGFLNLKAIGELAHVTENLLDKGRKGTLALTGANIDVIFEAIDVMKHMISTLQQAVEASSPFFAPDQLPALIARIKDCAEGKDLPNRIGQELIEESKVDRNTLREALEEQRTCGTEKKIGEILVEKGKVKPEDIESVAQKQQQSRSQAAASAGGGNAGTPRHNTAESTIKITTGRLDSLINMVGELMVAQSMVSQDLNDYLSTNQRLERNSRQLNKITRDLQELSMSMRMVPVQGLFQKMARLVRDLSRKAGKEIDFQIEGAETELDRTVVESIADPLVHMVRNSVDHGVESPNDREQAGKPRQGHVTLRAYHQGGNIVIEIADDGKGLSREKILKKAIDNGIVKEGQDISDKDVYRLIFHAGLSTAEKVTDISGRGVGMDVVRKNIESLRGRIDIDSTAGQGTVFRIRLPLTLAVIEGQIVTIAEEKYIIPMLSIESSLRPGPEQLSSVYGGQGQTIQIHGQLLPLIRLHELFNIEPKTTDPCEGLVVIVADGQKRCCLLVDDLAGQQQVVIKNLGSFLGTIRGVSGGAIMGDGNVALILDVPGLMQLAQVGNAAEMAMS